jgi:uncharacterized ParB-like nuclease family protein
MISTIEISKIRIDAGTQSRESLSEALVQEYHEHLEQDGDFPPIEVFLDGTEYFLADGFHRVLAFRRSQREYIEARVNFGAVRDAIQYSLSANSEHGLRRTRADKCKAVNTALDDPKWGELSGRQIAKMCGVSHTLVQEVTKSRNSDTPPKDKPTKLKNLVEAPLKEDEVAILPPQADEMVQELISENERLQDLVAVGGMDGTDEEKALASETIDDLRVQVSSLTTQLESVKLSRDQFQRECSELKKQVGIYQRQLKK